MKLFFTAAALIMLATSAHAESAAKARAICEWIDSTGMTSAPCEVSWRRATVTATVDMSVSDARVTCMQIADLIRQRGHKLSGRVWKLQFKSPFSGDNTIAFCELPN